MFNYLAARGYFTSIGIDTLAQSDESFARMCNDIVAALNTPVSDQVIIYTDGACSGNPGPGGWGAVLMFGEHKKELSGSAADTTNNRMELLAAIQALSALKKPCMVDLYSDSAYLINAFAKGWLAAWQQNGWRKSDKKPVENQDLWEQLVVLTNKHSVNFVKVKGHADNPYNNRCDELAVAAYKALMQQTDEVSAA